MRNSRAVQADAFSPFFCPEPLSLVPISRGLAPESGRGGHLQADLAIVIQPAGRHAINPQVCRSARWPIAEKHNGTVLFGSETFNNLLKLALKLCRIYLWGFGATTSPLLLAPHEEGMRKGSSTMKTRVRTRLSPTLAALGVISAAYVTAFAPVAHAAAILYTITFTATLGIDPTAGSFLYDSSAAQGSQFSSSSVTYDGASFDLTKVEIERKILAGADTRND